MCARQARPAGDLTTGLELVLCACESELHIVLTDDEELVASLVWNLQDRATELLAPSLETLFRLAGRSFADLRRVGCVRGPGSFTGIRLVLATAAALRRTTRARLAALDYMQALATTMTMREQLLFGRVVWVATHARRDLVHLAGFTSYGPVIPAVCTSPVRLLAPDAALEEIRSSARSAGTTPVHVLGSALGRQKALAAALEADDLIAARDVRAPSVEALRLLGRHGDYFPRDVEPLYVRPCDAVENLPSLAERMGADGAASKARLEELLTRKAGDESDATGGQS